MFGSLEKTNFNPDQSREIESVAVDLAQHMINDYKGSWSQANFTEALDRAVDHLNKRLFFPVDKKLLWDLAVKHLLKHRADQDYKLKEGKGLIALNHYYIEDLQKSAQAEAKEQGDDFRSLLSEKLHQAKLAGLDLDDNYIKDHQDAWSDQYYSNL